MGKRNLNTITFMSDKQNIMAGNVEMFFKQKDKIQEEPFIKKQT